MSDNLRIVDAPELPYEELTDDVKIPTGGKGNYSVKTKDLVKYTVESKNLANKSDVQASSNGVKALLDAHKSDKSNPHGVTKVQIGLGNVNNTADLDKPVSSATQAAIISANQIKADKTYVDTELGKKANSQDVTNSLNTKEDKTVVTNLRKLGGVDYWDGGTYPLNGEVRLDNGDIVKSIVSNNTKNPNNDMTGWELPQAKDIYDESGKTQQEINNFFKKQKFSVKSYGAKGSTANIEIDDGDAIIAAIQACSDAGGGEVFFDPLPNGGYYASTLRSQLTNINNVKINGNKQKLYTINPEITAKGSRSPFYITTGDSIEVFGFYFDGRYESFVSKDKRINSHNFAGESLSNVKIYHNVFANCGYPNNTSDEAGDSVYIIRNSHDIDIFENIFINPARWSISFQYNTADLGGIKIRNNFQYITRANKSLGFVDLEFSSSALATQVSDILIEDNTTYFSGYIAMSNASFKDVVIRNNTMKGYTYGANRVYKSTDYPYGFGILIQPDTGRLPIENIEISDNTFDSVNKQNLEILFASKGLKVTKNKFYTQPDAPTTCGFSKGVVIANAIDLEVSGNSILGTANQSSTVTLSVTNSTGLVYDNVAKHSSSTTPTSFSSIDNGELCVYSNYLETQNSTFQFSLGSGVLFWDNTTPTGKSGRISSGAVVKFYGKNNTKLNSNYNGQITNKFFAGQGDLSIAYANAAPTTGTWMVGDIVYNTAPSNGGVLGWSCVSASGSGTWTPFGSLGVQKLTTANLQSVAHAVNTTNKFIGKTVINSTDGKMYYADGASSESVWKTVDGTATITPTL